LKNAKVFRRRIAETQCGSQPAGDGGVSVNINVEPETAIASLLAPTGMLLKQ
jgi:hypothetical protein